MDGSAQASGSGGFHHSPRRIVVEVGAVLAALGLLVWGALAAVSWGASALVPLIPLSLDARLGEAAWAQYAPASSRCTDPAALAYVEEVAAPLVRAMHSEHEFHFAVVEDPAINAFALPGGYVTVNLGLLRAAESGEEVAAVLAHELYHVERRHGLTRIMQQVGGGVALSVLLGGADLGALTGLALSLSGSAYGRDQERESDRLGRALLLKARIDPGGMARFFDRLAREHPTALPALLSSHPGSEERARLAAEGASVPGEARALAAPPRDLPCR